MNVNELIGKVIEFAGKVTETDYDFDPKQRAKIIAVQDTNDNFGTLKLTLDFKEFAEYNKQFANHDYFDKDQKATLAWHETSFYPKDFRYNFFADRKQIENDTIEFVVLDELSLKFSCGYSAACSQEWIEEFSVKQSLREAVDHYCSKIKTILAETNDYRQVAYTGDFERRMMELLTHILK